MPCLPDLRILLSTVLALKRMARLPESRKDGMRQGVKFHDLRSPLMCTPMTRAQQLGSTILNSRHMNTEGPCFLHRGSRGLPHYSFYTTGKSTAPNYL